MHYCRLKARRKSRGQGQQVFFFLLSFCHLNLWMNSLLFVSHSWFLLAFVIDQQTTNCHLPPPPPVLPHPLSFPRGGAGGPSLGQHKKFYYGSLCCCVGGCVVRHCHLYPLHSWQDILLTFAEMELDSTTMFTPGTNVMFICSTGEPVWAQVVGYSEHGDAYLRISYGHEGKTVLPLYSFVLQCNSCA